MKARLLLPAVVLACLAAGAAFSDDLVPMRRYALVSCSNDGGPTRARLKYSESDARSFAAVIEELGGVRPDDLVMAVNPNLSRFQSAFERVEQLMSAPRPDAERRELLVYYSGHSDDDGLILGSESLSWEELRGRINDIPADVKVAILDSCSSGSLTRAKGGVARPAFLFDASSDMKGHAYLTSSSAEEAAQESDRIGASFFTHFLVSGLRGAADSAGNGVVTLNEAYAFAYQETLASTEKTQYGPQHPAYDISLTGSGDLVLTDLRAASAKLLVSEDLDGRLYIRDARNVLAVELDKTQGQSVELALTPGSYKVVLDGKAGRLGTTIRISARQTATLSRSALRPVPVDRTTARGTTRTADGRAVGQDNRSNNRSEPRRDDPVETAAAIGAAVGRAVATAITTTVDAVSGGGRAAAEPETDSAPDAEAQSGGAAGRAETRQLEPTYDAFHFTLLPEISSGLFASRENHSVSVNLLFGTSSSNRGFEVGGLGNFESTDVSGFQAAGLTNVVLGAASGFQAAGLVNVVGGRASFFQTAGLVNVTAGEVRGAQVAGFFNWAGDELWGAQISGIGNRGTVVNGPQISVVNIAGVVSGAQIGVVNIAGHVNGVQIGVVNISREIDGVPIGLVSIEERGRHALDVWYDTDGAVNGALSFGTKWFYTVLSAGWVPDSQVFQWTLGLGLGTRVPMGRLWADVDLSVLADQGAFREVTGPAFSSVHPRLRAAVGIPVFGGTAIEAGISVEASLPNGPDWSNLEYSPALLIGMQI
jgi:hypothetical protein